MSEQKRFNESFIARTKALRADSGRSQAQMATDLGVSLDNYKKYEKRTPLPHYLLGDYALDNTVSCLRNFVIYCLVSPL